MNLGFLASGRGSNFQAVADACLSGDIDAKPAIVISNNSDAFVLERARGAGIDTAHISSLTHPDEDERDLAMRDTFRAHGVDWIVLAGFMKKLGPRTLSSYDGRIINVHPALLPKYGGRGMFGMRVHEAVVAAGETETGATVHLVDSEYDTGAVIAQSRIAISRDETAEQIAERVLVVEHALLIGSLAQICADG